jgi:prolyl-tRNA synthetase
MFDIQFESEDGSKKHVWQNSWGLTTRTIGVMVMVHSDDLGLVLPPRVAKVQVVVVPVGVTGKTSPEVADGIWAKTNAITDLLKEAGVRVTADLRKDKTSGFKFGDWELKGVPLRVEIGQCPSPGASFCPTLLLFWFRLCSVVFGCVQFCSVVFTPCRVRSLASIPTYACSARFG